MLNINSKDKVAIRLLALYELVLRLTTRTRPYEEMQGETQKIATALIQEAKAKIPAMTRDDWKAFCERVVDSFEIIPLENDATRAQVGVIGAPVLGERVNARPLIARAIEEVGAEASFLGTPDYLIIAKISPYTPDNALKTRSEWDKDLQDAKRIQRRRWAVYDALKKSDRYRELGVGIYKTEKKLASLTYNKALKEVPADTFDAWTEAYWLKLFRVQGLKNILVLNDSLEDEGEQAQAYDELKALYPEVNLIAVDTSTDEPPANVILDIAHALQATNLERNAGRAEEMKPFARTHKAGLCSAHQEGTSHLMLSEDQVSKLEDAKKRHEERLRDQKSAASTDD